MTADFAGILGVGFSSSLESSESSLDSSFFPLPFVVLPLFAAFPFLTGAGSSSSESSESSDDSAAASFLGSFFEAFF